MDAKRAGHRLVVLGRTGRETGGSHLRRVACGAVVEATDDALPEVDLAQGPRLAEAVHRLIGAGLVRSAHDPSEGGVLVAAAEMAFAGGLGATIDLDGVGERLSPIAAAFAPAAFAAAVAAAAAAGDDACAARSSTVASPRARSSAGRLAQTPPREKGGAPGSAAPVASARIATQTSSQHSDGSSAFVAPPPPPSRPIIAPKPPLATPP